MYRHGDLLICRVNEIPAEGCQMDKIQQVCEAIKAAHAAAGELFSPYYSVYTISEDYRISLTNIRDFEQIPGEIEFVKRECEVYPWKIRKFYQDVEFYKLLSQGKYEAFVKQ